MLFPGNLENPGRHAGAYDPGTSRLRRFRPFLIALVILCLLAWPFIEPFLIEVEEVTLPAADFPQGIGSLRVVYLSDIHAGSFFSQSRVESLVRRVNALDPDIVLLGGDYATDSDGAVEFFRSLPRLHARYGVYAVTGNHDRTVPESNLAELRAAMQSAGVVPLINVVTPVRVGASTIWLAGLDDVSCGHPDLTALTSQARSQDYVIFLSHSPAIIPQALEARDGIGHMNWFDLGLFGHTHGGQVNLFGGVNRDESVPDAYRTGWKRVGRVDLLTSRGVGTTGLPVRLFCRPQIHLLTLTTYD